MRRSFVRWLFGPAIGLLVLLSLPATSLAIDEFPLLSTCSGAPAPAPPGSTTCLPGGITAGPDGAMWITEEYGNRIVRMTTSGTVTHQIGIPTSNSLPSEIAAGPDGLMWFTEFNGNKIGRVNANFTITEFNLSGNPDGIVAHAGSLWVTRFGSDQISRIDPANPTSPADTYTVGNEPGDITVGPDGRLWFTESAGNAIGVISTAGGFIDYPLTPGVDPADITATSGALWFTEGVGNRIGRISTAGVITNEFFAGAGTPSGIATGSDGALYYTETDPNKIGRMTTAGTITNEFAVPTAGSQPGAIAPGPDGALWFAEHAANKIGRIAPAPPFVPSPPAPPAAPPVTSTKKKCKVPKLRGLTVKKARKKLKRAKCKYKIRGKGKFSSSKPKAGRRTSGRVIVRFKTKRRARR